MSARTITADEARSALAILRDHFSLQPSYADARVSLVAALETVVAQAVEIERLIKFLPPIALVVCPACGGGVEGELDDDAEYITCLHHRGVAQDGLSLVRCDGGIARESAR